MKVLVTGGAGFIGSALVRLLVKKRIRTVIVDKLTYAGDISRLESVRRKITLYRTDIRNIKSINALFNLEKPDIVVNTAAESHVDKSISNPTPFLETNIKGTKALMDMCRTYAASKFIHISTDEVYGEAQNSSFTEPDSLNPGNPYSASKAGAECLINAYHRTYGLPSIIIRPCNNYGYYQHKEKFIPHSIHLALKNKPIYLHGDGSDIREWLYVDDCARGILAVMAHGNVGDVYNLGSGYEAPNIEVARFILRHLNKPLDYFEFGPNRPGHDRRYSLNSSKLKKISRHRNTPFSVGLKQTVQWYEKNYPLQIAK